MERMSIDEAIAHARDVGKKNRENWKNCPANRDDIAHQTCEQCAEEHEQLAEWLEELKEYIQLEEQGLLLKLPCKVGDTLCWFDSLGEYHEDIANCIYTEQGLKGIKIETLCCQINAEEIGKTVFLTQAESEEALKRMER